MPSQLFCFIFVLRKFASLSSAFLCSPKTGHLKSTALSVCLLRKPFASSICISADQSVSLHLSDAPAFLRFWSSFRPISSSQLHTSLCFHLCPIYLVVFKGSSTLRSGDLILRRASRLDAFSVYPFPSWLPSRAIGMTTGPPADGPSRSSRTKDSPSQISCARAG